MTMIPAVGNRHLPSGTVTFLFTDVEGSTKLLHALGADAYADAVARGRTMSTDDAIAIGFETAGG